MKMNFSKSHPIKIEDFVVAIAVSCPFHSLYQGYISDLVNTSPKSKNQIWIDFCKSLQASDNPVNRSWRVRAHKIFMMNLREIELDFWRRTYYISDPTNSFKILRYLPAAMITTELTKQEFKSTKKYLSERSGVKYEESCSDDDSVDSKKVSSDEEIIDVVGIYEELRAEEDGLHARAPQDGGPGSAGSAQGREGDVVGGGENIIKPIDPVQIGPLRVNQIITCLYRATGMALANEEDDIIAAMRNLTTKESKDDTETAGTSGLSAQYQSANFMPFSQNDLDFGDGGPTSS